MTEPFSTDDEFAVLFPIHSAEQREQLEASLRAHGCREPLVVWKEEKLLLDGHTRLALCRQHRIEFATVEYSFPDRDAARRWVIDNQLSRRNLTREQRDYLVGKRYLSERKPEGRPAGELPQSEAVSAGRTSAAVAAAAGVSRATVERAAEFAAAIDKISETCPKAKNAILTGKVKLTREQASRVAETAPRSLGQVKQAAAAVAKRPAPAASAARLPRDHVGEIETLALRLSASIDAYSKSGLRSSDRPRLKSLWELRAEIEGLNAALAGKR
ncbi:MAG: hypothetical protein K8T90_08710 [Planctomycetes bacterium]|nr:hypothetical protein [Planctomycetota bacterium]